MRLNVIHLRHRQDRMELLLKQLKEQQIKDYQIWPGVICSHSPQSGISKAHKQIVNQAKQQGLPEVLIAEDDIKFTAPGAFRYFLENSPAEYDLYLGGLSFGKLSEEKQVTDFAGLLLYMVNSRFYDTFLAANESEHLDRSLRSKGKYFACDPQPSVEHTTYSDNLKMQIDLTKAYQGRNLFKCY